MKISLYILTILLCLSCSKQNKLEEISIQLDKETLNPVRNPGEKGTLRVIGHYSNGKTSDLSLSELALSVRTVSASGNVEVVALSGDQLIPKDGGLAEVTAVYQKDGATYRAKKRVVVAPYYRDYHQTLVLKLDNEIIVYSGDGYESRSWLMPEGWEKVDAVDVYSISMNEPTLKSSAIPVDNGLLKLTLGKGEAVSIVPAGQVFTR